MRRIFIGLLASFTIFAWAQNEPFFTSQCIVKNSTGFNWEKNWWESKDYRPGKIFIARKIDHREHAFKGNNIFDRPIMCEKIEDFILDLGFFENNDKARDACYSIKEHGSTESLYLSAEKCIEVYDQSGKLKEVQCKKIRFSPDGLFILLPSDVSMNLEPYPKTGKDSLSLSVGTCARIN